MFKVLGFSSLGFQKDKCRKEGRGAGRPSALEPSPRVEGT